MKDVKKDKSARKEERKRESVRGKLEYYQDLIRRKEKIKQEESELEI